jgi:heat shock protein HslJ
VIRRRTAPVLAALLAAVVSATLLAGCSAFFPNPWIGGWALRSFGGQPATTPSTLSFSSSDLVVDTGCNKGAGQYEYQGDQLTVRDMAFTARACPDPAFEAQDAAVRSIAAGPSRMSAGGKELTIDPGGGAPVLVYDRTSGA